MPEHQAHNALEQKFDDKTLVHEISHFALAFLKLDRQIAIDVTIVQLLQIALENGGELLSNDFDLRELEAVAHEDIFDVLDLLLQ